jgi:hypothetical protein
MDGILSQVDDDVHGGGLNWYEFDLKNSTLATLDRATVVSTVEISPLIDLYLYLLYGAEKSFVNLATESRRDAPGHFLPIRFRKFSCFLPAMRSSPMGRRRWSSRLTVEQCPLFLCARALHRSRLFTSPLDAIVTFSWPDSSGGILGKLDCHLDHIGTTGLALHIGQQLIRFGVAVDEQTVPVTTVRPHLGGKRYWLVCTCGKRAGRLYLSPGQTTFRCRICHNLAYTSAQQHN